MGRFEVDRLKTKIVDRQLYSQLLEEKEQEKRYEIEQIEKMRKIEISKILENIENTDEDTSEYKRKLLKEISSIKDNKTVLNITLSTFALLRKKNKIDIKEEQDFIEEFRNIIRKADKALKADVGKLKVPSSNEILLSASSV